MTMTTNLPADQQIAARREAFQERLLESVGGDVSGGAKLDHRAAVGRRLMAPEN
jgi:hypothetical protein